MESASLIFGLKSKYDSCRRIAFSLQRRRRQPELQKGFLQRDNGPVMRVVIEAMVSYLFTRYGCARRPWALMRGPSRAALLSHEMCLFSQDSISRIT